MQSDKDAVFREVYEGYRPALRVIAKRCGLPSEEIDDIIQDTFVAYIANYSIDRDAESMKAILTKILRNKCIDYARKYKKYNMISMDAEEKPLREIDLLNRHVSNDPLAIVIEHDKQQRVWKALKEMRSDWADALILFVVQDRPIEEVSEILGVSEEACRTRMSRGRKYLKEILKWEQDDEK